MKFKLLPRYAVLCVSMSMTLMACSGGRRSEPQEMPSGPELPEQISLDGLTSLEVSPTSGQTASLNGAPANFDFSAIGHFADGHSADVSRAVTWAISDPSLGLVQEGRFSTGLVPPVRGGQATVTASASGLSAQAEITMKYQISRVSADDNSTAPANADQLFASATQDATLVPALVYPLDQTRVPSNLNDLEIQWRGTGLVYEVSIASPLFSLKVYTNAPLGGGARYSLLPSEWNALAATIKDASVLISVRALANGRVGTSAPIRMEIAAAPVLGGIYYWSNPGNASAPYQPGVGIIRREFGDPNAVAQPFYTGATVNAFYGTQGHCVGCHYLSRDGKKMAMAFDDGVSAMIDVGTKAFMVQPASPRVPFVSFAPDGNRAVRHNADWTKLAIYDTSTTPQMGSLIETIETPQGIAVTHPDWSPDGSKIVYVESPDGWPWDRAGGSLKIVRTDANGKFTIFESLLQSQGENNYYPTFSPDGLWILFNRSESNDSAYDATDAEVWVMPSDGSRAPVKLTFANGEPMKTNSWPRWTPFVQTYGAAGDPLYYFTFSSKRDYGLQLVGAQRAQVWMASFNPRDLSTGIDSAGGGSSAAFWIPFQDPATSNHNAQWVEAIVPSIN